MGTFSVTIEAGSSDHSRWEPVEVLVDTGATFTWLPGELLERLGHVPTLTKSFQLGDGRVIEAETGDVPVRIGEETHTTVCAFARNGEKSTLGAVTLEQFLLAPDPVNKRLVPVVGLALRRQQREHEAAS